MAVAEYVCASCGHEHCPDCVVFAQGPRRPPMCIACALEAGGIRRNDKKRPAKLSRREVRKRLRDRAELEANPPQPADDDTVTVSVTAEPEPVDPWAFGPDGDFFTDDWARSG